MSTKRYPEEFKTEAVKQVTERGHTVADVASPLGVSTSTKRTLWPSPRLIRFEPPLSKGE